MNTTSILLAAIVAIIMEKAVAEFLLVEVDGEDKKGMIHLVYAKSKGQILSIWICIVLNPWMIFQTSILSTKGKNVLTKMNTIDVV